VALPEGSLDRTRLVATAIGSLALLTEFPQMGNAMRSPEYVRLATASVVVALLILVGAYLRGRSSWWTAVPLPLLITIGGAGLKDPVATTAFAMTSTIVVSLYGSTPLWLFRLAGALVSIPVATAISPLSGDRPMAWNSATILGVLPQVLLMAVLARGIYHSLLRQELAAAREALLARAGLAMLGVTDAEQIRGIGRKTAAEVVALSPGIAMLVLRRAPGGLEVTTVIGAPPEIRGRVLSLAVVTDHQALIALAPGFRVWHLDSLGADPAVAGAFIAVAGRQRIRPEVLDALRSLSHQVILAEKGCHAHAELEHRAHHDHLTELPTRAKFIGAVDQALAAGKATAVLNVDLDDFKQVNDCYGHAAGDELLVQVAERMTAVTAGRGLAGRLGGDEFAVLLTDLTERSDAERVAAQLCAALAAPVTLSVATVTVGASIGVAVADPGVTVTELTRRADIAMYAAKVAGKNRIEAFPPAQPVAA
jgi:diguanylate cyclase (GGDEF)-like protein